jgi:hypothetical protein
MLNLSSSESDPQRTSRFPRRRADGAAALASARQAHRPRAGRSRGEGARDGDPQGACGPADQAMLGGPTSGRRERGGDTVARRFEPSGPEPAKSVSRYVIVPMDTVLVVLVARGGKKG